MIYLYLLIAAIFLGFVCKGVPIMRDMIRNDHGEYEIHIKKNKEAPKDTKNKNKPERSAADILEQMYAEDEQKTGNK